MDEIESLLRQLDRDLEARAKAIKLLRAYVTLARAELSIAAGQALLRELQCRTN
jgi:hypothetical protein